MKSYEIAEVIAGKTIKSASLGGTYSTIYFTDGTKLEMEAQDSGPDEWGHHESAHTLFSFAEKKT